MELFGKIFLIGLAAIAAVIMLTSALAPAITPVVSLEAKNFTANNTYIALGHSGANSDLRLYYNNSEAFPISAAKYTYNSSHIKIYTNGTIGYPNITNGTVLYYASYTYNRSMTIWGLDFGWILLIVVIVALLYVAYQFIPRV